MGGYCLWVSIVTKTLLKDQTTIFLIYLGVGEEGILGS